jgi:pyruvate formate lyase activating enzyme
VKGRIYDIQGFAVHDGPGIRTTVYTKGCPLRCLWCHSPESQRLDDELSWLAVKCVGVESCGGECLTACTTGALTKAAPEKALKGDEYICKVELDRGKCTECLACTAVCPTKALAPTGREITVEEAYQRVDKDRFFFRDGGGATISGGEPMLQFEFTKSLAQRFHEGGLHVCLDTTGFAPAEHYLELLDSIDLFLYDIKHMDSQRHRKLVGVPNELILSNARLLAERGAALQIRVPVIPKLNAGRENLEGTAAFCAELGEAVKLVQLLPYHSMGKSKYTRIGWEYKLKNVDVPSNETMAEALELFRFFGLPAQLR